MKKLLALILCVVMVLSLAPAAFASNYNQTAGITTPAAKVTTDIWASLANAKKAVKQASESIQTAYAGLAADQGVFGTITAIDSVVRSLADGMFEGIDEVDLTALGGAKISGDTAADTTKAFLRLHIGNEISNYMIDHAGAYTKVDSNGNVIGIKPEKYLATFATAATKALNSSKAQKNIEAVVYAVALAKTLKDVSDGMDDLYAEMQEWVADNADFNAYGWTALTDPSVTGNAWTPLAFLDADAVYTAPTGTTDPDYELSTIFTEWTAMIPTTP